MSPIARRCSLPPAGPDPIAVGFEQGKQTLGWKSEPVGNAVERSEERGQWTASAICGSLQPFSVSSSTSPRATSCELRLTFSTSRSSACSAVVSAGERRSFS